MPVSDVRRSFEEIRRTTLFPTAEYSVTVMLHAIERQLADWSSDSAVVLDPDFQRGHVWTTAQQAAYVEYLLQGGPSARTLFWACDGWPTSTAPIYLVDGLQRLTAVRKFMRDDLRIFGQRLSEFPDDVCVVSLRGALKFNVACVDRAQMLRWYIALNAGGTPHTADEIARVRVLLESQERR